MSKEKNIQEQVELKFQAVLARSEENPELKCEVFKTISQIEAAAELIDLFTIKMVLTEGALFHSQLSLDKDETNEEKTEL